MKLLVFIFIILMTYAWCLPSKYKRRSSISSSEPEVVIRVPLRKETRVHERKVGWHCQNNSRTSMSLFKLGGRNAATCNDGTDAGYYLMRQEFSNEWVIFLEGGWYCADEATCKFRQRVMPKLTSSKNWPACKSGNGIFSNSQKENPHLYASNMVYIPYCSSDVWSGMVRKRILGRTSFSFMGSVIIKQVIQQLLYNHGMQKATLVVMAGSSAGGTGVFMNVDLVEGYLRTSGNQAKVLGIVDSAWFLLRPSMDLTRDQCSNPINCSPVSMIKMGVTFWRANIPSDCVKAQRRNSGASTNFSNHFGVEQRDDRWKCFFGSVIYPHIKTDLFIIQWMFDPVQLESDQMSLMDYHLSTKKRLQYINDLYDNLNNSFTPVKALFVTSCIAHVVLDNSDWHSATVSQVSLPDAIQCWIVNSLALKDETNYEGDIVDDEPTVHIFGNAEQSLSSHTAQYSEISNEQSNAFGSSAWSPDNDDEITDSYFPNYLNDDPEANIIISGKCKQKFIDPCPLPQCNPTCKPIYDRRSHVRLNQIDFLKKIGIDIASFAAENGFNPSQLLVQLSNG